MRKLKNATLLQNDGALRSGLQPNALASLVHFAHNKVIGMQVHCFRGKIGGCHHFVVGGVLEFSHPCLDSVLFIGPSLTFLP